MKLYLTELLKEANAAGFANQPNTNFSAVAKPAPIAPPAPVAPMAPMAPTAPLTPQPISLEAPKFTPTI